MIYHQVRSYIHIKIVKKQIKRSVTESEWVGGGGAGASTLFMFDQPFVLDSALVDQTVVHTNRNNYYSHNRPTKSSYRRVIKIV